jgi:DNA polymerase-1
VKKISEESIFLIDGSSLLYRSYYGIRPLHTSTGIPTQAVFGFCRAIKKIVDDFDPKYMIIAWDSKGKTFRSDIFKEYKATRQAAPSDIFVQKESIVKFADLVGIHQYARKGYEADDLIYSIAKENKNKNIVIVGSDKDLRQLISKNLVILDPMKKEIFDEKVFLSKYGFMPEKLSFFHAIVGDPSDNIPGVRGIGKRGATELVKKYKSLKDLYDNIEKIKKERTKKLLIESKDDAFLSLKLFSLKYIKTPVTKKKMLFEKKNWYKANDLFRELEFKSLLSSEGEKQTIIFKQKTVSGKAKKTSSKKWKCVIVRAEKDLLDLAKLLKEKKLFGLDTETTGVEPLKDELVGLSVAYDTKKSFYIPIAHVNDQQLDKEVVFKKLGPIFQSKTIKKVLHHAKFDRLVLHNAGVELDGIIFDTLLAANLLREEWDKISLKILSVKYLGEKMESFSDVMGKEYKTFDQVPIPTAATYAAHDSLQTLKLYKVLKKELHREKKFKDIFEKMEMPLSEVLFEMEKTGIALDAKILKKIEAPVNRKLKTIEKKIFGAIKTSPVNLNSPKQIEKLLFDQLKLPVVKKSVTGRRSTSAEVLAELSKTHPVPGLILQYRELFKLKSTYIEALPEAINPKTNRIHTSFSQTMVRTGRLSSSNPNLQNIPASGDLAMKIRSAFIAARGKQFVSADYSQIDLRVLAQLTKDKNLSAAFLEDTDIHKQTASQIFGIPIGKITHEQRQLGKRINFSIIYGLTPYGLSKDLGIKQKEAKEYIERYFEQYPKVLEWIEKVALEAKKSGFVETWFGRRRYVPGLKEKNRALYEASKRIAINSPVQGTSAEIMKLAMIRVYRRLKKEGYDSNLILQIHDEILLEVPNDEVKSVEKLIKEEMVSVVAWKIPLSVTIRTGKNWAKITK